MSRRIIISVPFFTLVFAVLMILPACGTKINDANFEKVKMDMTSEEVRKLLGPPAETSSVTVGGFSSASSTWESEEGIISIQFMNGKVKAKQFTKPGAKEDLPVRR